VITFLSVAVEAARSAGKLLREELGGTRRIHHKGIINIVTEMDQRSEALIIGRLLEAFPDHAVLAEEGGVTVGRSEYRWHIDPLDGTTNYAHGLPLFAVSIALERAGVVELGVALDVLVGTFIFGIFFFHIREQFESLDIRHMEKLKED